MPPSHYPIRIFFFARPLFETRNTWHRYWGRANIGVCIAGIAGNQYVYLGGRAKIRIGATQVFSGRIKHLFSGNAKSR